MAVDRQLLARTEGELRATLPRTGDLLVGLGRVVEATRIVVGVDGTGLTLAHEDGRPGGWRCRMRRWSCWSTASPSRVRLFGKRCGHPGRWRRRPDPKADHRAPSRGPPRTAAVARRNWSLIRSPESSGSAKPQTHDRPCSSYVPIQPCALGITVDACWDAKRLNASWEFMLHG
jgi:hypothetical protein